MTKPVQMNLFHVITVPQRADVTEMTTERECPFCHVVWQSMVPMLAGKGDRGLPKVACEWCYMNDGDREQWQ